MRIFATFIRAITLILTIALIAVLLLWMVFFPLVLKWQPYVVKSGSMEPLIKTGAIAFIDTKDKSAEKDKVITYRLDGSGEIGTGDTGAASVQEGALVTHRIVGFSGDALITKGDANDTVDLSPVKEEQIVGSYRFQIPRAGRIAEKLGFMGGSRSLLWFILSAFIGLNIVSSILTGLANETHNHAASKKDSKQED